MLKLIFKIFVLIVACILGLMILGFVLHLLGFLFLLAVGLLFLGGFVYLIRFLFKISSNTNETKQESYKLFNYSQPAAALFLAEPTVKDLVNVQKSDFLAEGTLNGTILEIENDTQVIVLDDLKEKDAVRVKVSQGKYKGRDGWVCRSVLCKSADEKLLPGQN
jgi:hypothetical protein